MNNNNHRKKNRPRATVITPEHRALIREFGQKAEESLRLRGIHWWPEPENQYDDEGNLIPLEEVQGNE